jgi:hypothetical protein
VKVLVVTGQGRAFCSAATSAATTNRVPRPGATMREARQIVTTCSTRRR